MDKLKIDKNRKEKIMDTNKDKKIKDLEKDKQKLEIASELQPNKKIYNMVADKIQNIKHNPPC